MFELELIKDGLSATEEIYKTWFAAVKEFTKTGAFLKFVDATIQASQNLEKTGTQPLHEEIRISGKLLAMGREVANSSPKREGLVNSQFDLTEAETNAHVEEVLLLTPDYFMEVIQQSRNFMKNAEKYCVDQNSSYESTMFGDQKEFREGVDSAIGKITSVVGRRLNGMLGVGKTRVGLELGHT